MKWCVIFLFILGCSSLPYFPREESRQAERYDYEILINNKPATVVVYDCAIAYFWHWQENAFMLEIDSNNNDTLDTILWDTDADGYFDLGLQGGNYFRPEQE